MSVALDLEVSNILWVQEDEHSPLGPSAAERWINCPGSVALCKDIPDPGSDFALEGTAAHGLSEACRETNKPAQEFLGWTMRVETRAYEDGYKDFPVTQEMVDAVQEFIDKVAEADGDDLCEERVHYGEYVPKGFGKLDAARLTQGLGVITDLKYGKGIQVYAKDHTQTKIYALATYLMYNWLYNFKVFWLQIAQPRLDHMDTWPIKVEDLLKWAEEVLRPAAKRVADGDKTLKAGDWCTFCRVKLTCKTRAMSIMHEVVDEFENLDEAVAKTETLSVDSCRDISHVEKLLKCSARVIRFFKALKVFAMKELQQGNPVGDCKLVAGRSKRVSAVPEDQYIRRLLEFGLPEGSAYKMEPISPPAAEKILGKDAFAPAKEATTRKPARDAGPLHDLIRALPGKPTIAFGDDPRPALAQCDLSDFDSLDDDDMELTD